MRRSLIRIVSLALVAVADPVFAQELDGLARVRRGVALVEQLERRVALLQEARDAATPAP